MRQQKLPLHASLMTALKALPQDPDMKHTIDTVDGLDIPEEDYFNVVMFIEILLDYRTDFTHRFQKTQLLMELHKECLKRFFIKPSF